MLIYFLWLTSLLLKPIGPGVLQDVKGGGIPGKSHQEDTGLRNHLKVVLFYKTLSLTLLLSIVEAL